MIYILKWLSLLCQLPPTLLLSYHLVYFVFFFFFPHPVHHLPWFTEKPNFCYQEKDPGICRGFFSRYFYNKETKICEIFKYGGCLGNQNNFRSLEECQTTCQGNCKLLSSLFLVLFLYKQHCVLKVFIMGKKPRLRRLWNGNKLHLKFTQLCIFKNTYKNEKCKIKRKILLKMVCTINFNEYYRNLLPFLFFSW